MYRFAKLAHLTNLCVLSLVAPSILAFAFKLEIYLQASYLLTIVVLSVAVTLSVSWWQIWKDRGYTVKRYERMRLWNCVASGLAALGLTIAVIGTPVGILLVREAMRIDPNTEGHAALLPPVMGCGVMTLAMIIAAMVRATNHSRVEG